MIKSQVDDPLNKKVFDKIEAARKNLLDLGLRNRLLNFKIDGQRVIRVFDELPDQVYDTLIIQKKSMKFAPVKSSFAKTEQIKFSDEDSTLGQPVENIYDENRNILAQSTLYDIKDEFQNPLYKVKTNNTDINTEETWDTINEGI